jgi:hypothetical protein
MQGYTLRKLCETDKLFLGNEYETAVLIEKSTGEATELGSFYGDPKCGIIDTESKWCIVGGSEGLVVWYQGTIIEINDDELHWSYALRQIDFKTVQVLTDPWSEKSAIWELDLHTLEYRKIRDFDDYKDKLYTENVVW